MHAVPIDPPKQASCDGQPPLDAFPVQTRNKLRNSALIATYRVRNHPVCQQAHTSEGGQCLT